MVKIFGEINGVDVHFNSIKELRDYKVKPEDEILLIVGNKAQGITTYEGMKNLIMPKRDRYGYSMNKRDKGMLGYYKDNHNQYQK